LWNLGKKAITSWWLACLAVLGVAASWAGVGELAVLLGGGAITVLAAAASNGWKPYRAGIGVLAVILVSIAAFALLAPGLGFSDDTPFSLHALFLFFLKVGGVLYGSGYVLLAFIESALVDRWEWITQAQLLDAVAVGQVTPGPLFTTATFIGFLKAGLIGAAVATVGIFLPAFLFVALLGPLLPRMRQSPTAGAFLDGVNATALALMAVVTLQLGVGSLTDPIAIAIALVAAVLLFAFKVSATWLIFGGAITGLILGYIQTL
jgi:chromate transporter